MRHALTNRRRRLLIEDARFALAQLDELSDGFGAGGARQQAALSCMCAIRAQLRGLLGGLAAAAEGDEEVSESGAALLCTAVRASEAVLALSDRLSWFEAFVEQSGQFNDKSLHGKLLGNFGNALADAGRLGEAEAVLRRRLEVARQAGNVDGVALAQEHLGKLLVRRGRFVESEPLLEAAFDAARRRGDESAVTRLLTDVANARARHGDLSGCLKLLEERLQRCRQAGDHLLELSTHHTLAARLMNAGRLDEATHHGERALAIAKGLRLPRRRATVLGTLADIALDQGQLDLARGRIHAARRTFRKTGNVVMQGNAATTLGLIAAKEGRFRRAAKWYRESLEISRATGRNSDEAADLGNLAGVLAALGNYEDAMGLYESRLTILKRLGEERRAADTRFSLAQVHAQVHRFNRALALANEALDFFRSDDPAKAAEISARIVAWQGEAGADVVTGQDATRDGV